MRVLAMALLGTLGLTASAGHTVPLASTKEQLSRAPGIVEVWGGCGWGWHPVPGHWSQWRGSWVPPHCAPNRYGGWGPYWRWPGPYGGWGAGWDPYWAWRAPYHGWVNP